MTGGWFTLTELQERLNREDRESLRKTVRAKGIPMVQFGRELLIREAAWLAWMQASEISNRNTVHPDSSSSTPV
jgi:hypothetical protein